MFILNEELTVSHSEDRAKEVAMTLRLLHTLQSFLVKDPLQLTLGYDVCATNISTRGRDV